MYTIDPGKTAVRAKNGKDDNVFATTKEETP